MDIGGTFTDICAFDEEGGRTRVGKVSSTRDPIDAVFEGTGAVGISPGEVGLFSHGTTVATNALITRRFGRTGMVTTKGFRNVVEIRRRAFRVMLRRRSRSHRRDGTEDA